MHNGMTLYVVVYCLEFGVVMTRNVLVCLEFSCLSLILLFCYSVIYSSVVVVVVVIG